MTEIDQTGHRDSWCYSTAWITCCVGTSRSTLINSDSSLQEWPATRPHPLSVYGWSPVARMASLTSQQTPPPLSVWLVPCTQDGISDHYCPTLWTPPPPPPLSSHNGPHLKKHHFIYPRLGMIYFCVLCMAGFWVGFA